MNRIVANRGIVQKWINELRPKAIKKYEENIKLNSQCTVYFNGEDGYEISEGEERHIIFLEKQVCTYKVWDLTGIPCPHAICA
uniref:SWIM-type domain-containing protein n=1 Tax=Manihot esculenta TaxID=3983 RepID=A0A2C9W1Z6_MANES